MTAGAGGSDDRVAAATPDATPAVSSVARQRWRLVLAREPDPDAVAGRELAIAWDEAIESSALPVHRPAGRSRGRIAFGAPAPAAMALEHELADLVLAEFVPRWHVRQALEVSVPPGWRLIDLYDVWLGAPALAGQVAAADYRIELDGGDASVVATAAASLLAADRLPRERRKGTDVVAYDLRPLLADARVVAAGPPVVVRVRTRFDPVLGTGRPEEVVAALGDRVGRRLDARSTVRERLLLAGDDPESGDEPASD